MATTLETLEASISRVCDVMIDANAAGDTETLRICGDILAELNADRARLIPTARPPTAHS